MICNMNPLPKGNLELWILMLTCDSSIRSEVLKWECQFIPTHNTIHQIFSTQWWLLHYEREVSWPLYIFREDERSLSESRCWLHKRGFNEGIWDLPHQWQIVLYFGVACVVSNKKSVILTKMHTIQGRMSIFQSMSLASPSCLTTGLALDELVL